MWRTVKLGDVCSIKTGKKDVNEGNPSGKYPFFTCAKEHTYSDEYSFECEAILIAGNGAVGQTTYYKGKFEAYQRTYVLTDFHSILPKLLLFILQGRLMAHLNSMVLGNTIPYIKKGMLQNFEIPVPPLAEQQRIVAKLDAAFAEIDRFQSVIEEKLLGFDAMRLKAYQAIISKHCSVQNQYKLSEVVDKSCSLSYGIVQPGDEVTDGLPVVRPVDLKSKWVGRDELKRIAKGRAEPYQRTKLFGGEVLLCVRGSTGIVSLASDEVIGGNVTRGIIPIRFADGINNEYGYYALQSEDAQKQIAAKTYGATLQQINVKDVKNLIITVPKIEEQLNAVVQIVEADNYLDKLQNTTHRQLESAKQLKLAILAQELQPSQSEAA